MLLLRILHNPFRLHQILQWVSVTMDLTGVSNKMWISTKSPGRFSNQIFNRGLKLDIYMYDFLKVLTAADLTGVSNKSSTEADIALV